MQIKYSAWEQGMKQANDDHILTCTRRSQAEQNALWAEGRAFENGQWVIVDPHAVRTWTLNSRHLTGDAFDFCIMVNGKPDWAMAHKDLWDKAIEIGKSVGLSQVVNHNGKVMEFAHLQEDV
jgi:predicted amidohydrolase